MKRIVNGIAVLCTLLAFTNVAQAAGLSFKRPDGSGSSLGTIKRIFVAPAADGTARLDLIFGTSTTHDPYCSIVGLALPDALQIVELIDTGVIIRVTCDLPQDSLTFTAVVGTSGYFLTAGS